MPLQRPACCPGRRPAVLWLLLVLTRCLRLTCLHLTCLLLWWLLTWLPTAWWLQLCLMQPCLWWQLLSVMQPWVLWQPQQHPHQPSALLNPLLLLWPLLLHQRLSCASAWRHAW